MYAFSTIKRPTKDDGSGENHKAKLIRALKNPSLDQNNERDTSEILASSIFLKVHVKTGGFLLISLMKNSF